MPLTVQSSAQRSLRQGIISCVSSNARTAAGLYLPYGGVCTARSGGCGCGLEYYIRVLYGVEEVLLLLLLHALNGTVWLCVNL